MLSRNFSPGTYRNFSVISIRKHRILKWRIDRKSFRKILTYLVGKTINYTISQIIGFWEIRECYNMNLYRDPDCSNYLFQIPCMYLILNLTGEMYGVHRYLKHRHVRIVKLQSFRYGLVPYLEFTVSSVRIPYLAYWISNSAHPTSTPSQAQARWLQREWRTGMWAGRGLHVIRSLLEDTVKQSLERANFELPCGAVFTFLVLWTSHRSCLKDYKLLWNSLQCRLQIYNWNCQSRLNLPT